MKKFKLLSLILAVIICLSTFTMVASANATGDVNGDGKANSTDARLALRCAVGLEPNLTAEQIKAADVDFDGKVLSGDARLILRSSVGLETLHNHTFTSEVTKPATCTEKGIITYTCHSASCKNTSYTEEIPMTAHTPAVSAAVAATCTAAGKTEGSYCSACNTVLTAQKDIAATGHKLNYLDTTNIADNKAVACCVDCDYKETYTVCNHTKTKISADKVTACTVAGCNGQLPSFNTIVNTLKSSEAVTGKKQMFTGVYEDIDHQDETEYKGTIGWTMDKVPASTTVKYSRGTNGFITNSNFPADNAGFVSTLTDKDVKSIKIEKVTNVKPLSPLPDKYTSGNREYSLVSLKAKTLAEAYKITVVLNNETRDINQAITGTSPYDKIYAANYNGNLEALRAEITKGFNDLSGTIPTDVVTKFKTSGSIGSNLTVEYYIDVNTYAPLAAKYAYRFDTAFNIDMAIALVGTLKMDQTMYMANNSYYIFGAV